MKKLIKAVLIWAYISPFRSLVQALSAKNAYRLGKLIGLLFYYLAPEKSAALKAECLKIPRQSGIKAGVASKRACVNRFLVEMEVLRFPLLSSGNISEFIEYEGLENLQKSIAAGKGTMLLFAHFGANQMVMPAMGYKGYKMCQISAPATVWEEKVNRRLSGMEKRLLEMRWRHEESLPVKHINVFGSMKEAFLCLKRNEVLGIAIDGGGGKSMTEVDFLGGKAYFSTGAMDMAVRTGCTVLPTFMLRLPDGKSRMIIEEQIDFGRGERSIELSTKAFVSRLEEYVCKYPCHYLNFMALRTFMEHNGETPFIKPLRHKGVFSVNER